MGIFIDQLEREHQTIRSMAEVAKKICQKSTQGWEIQSEHIDHILDFLDVFTDRCHERKEENGLLPALEKAGVLDEGKSVGAIIADHATLHTYLIKMKENHSKYKTNQHQGLSGVVGYMLNYLDFLSRHMEKEEKVFYGLANQTLSEEIQRELFKRFDLIDSSEIGKEKLERFNKIIELLTDVYLNQNQDVNRI